MKLHGTRHSFMPKVRSPLELGGEFALIFHWISQCYIHCEVHSIILLIGSLIFHMDMAEKFDLAIQEAQPLHIVPFAI
ncbi:hypothetical protein CUMW_250580 [Citrus unshiu]|uniref:Uncharacterized protein n=1 Tax=Citrus unshiu TaxID=55188 RepID=A0A2H5QQV9_CITUN|nr:hypothetical protein CUMW_250580 [Citrus unshiu]